jgi:thiol-disulfide isomerase/thioredoxin
MSRVAVLFVVIGALFAVAAPRVARDTTGGIGVAIGQRDGRLYVRKILQDGPAAASGQIRENDVLLAVAEGDAEPVDLGGDISKALDHVRGPVGSTVRLTVVAAGKPESEARVVSVVRAKIFRRLAPDDVAPDFKFTTLADDKPARLSDHRGKVVVLNFWASWCGPCREEMADLQTLVGEHPEWKGEVVVLAVSVDEDKAKAAKAVADEGWTRTTNVWGGVEAGLSYGIRSIPTTYVVARDGKLAMTAGSVTEAEIRPLLKEPPVKTGKK